MSLAGDADGEGQKRAAPPPPGLDPDRFRHGVSLDGADKPDSKDFVGWGSPVSPLRGPPAGPAYTSSSSSSSGSLTGKSPSNAAAAAAAGGGVAGGSHSGELSASGESSPTAAGSKILRATHGRSASGPLIFTGATTTTTGGGGSSTASSPITNVLPAGNICPSGKIGKTGMMPRNMVRSDVLGSGTGNYGHGSIIWAGMPSPGSGRSGGDHSPWTSANSSGTSRRLEMSTNLQEWTKAGNEHYKKGQYAEALRLYNKAVALCPDNASCRSNRAAALIGLGSLGEAMTECEEAIRLDPANGRAHHRIASLCLRFGIIETSKRHFSLAGPDLQPDPAEWQRLQELERSLRRCADARKIGDWKSDLREADSSIAAGADSSPLLVAARAEALLHLLKLEEADLSLLSAVKLHSSFPTSLSSTRFFGMLLDSYIYVVKAQVDTALGRFELAAVAAEKARQIDPRNMELNAMLNNLRLVMRARDQGNTLFHSGKFAEACVAYGEGLKYDPCNPVIYCNRAVCMSMLEEWEKSVEDCNEALRIHPGYTKALKRRAACYAKLERWAECVRDYEAISKQLPRDMEIAEALFRARISLKMSRSEEVSNMKFGGEVEEITTTDQFQNAVSLPGVTVSYFMAPLNQQCTKITPFVDVLCSQFPSVNFLRVNVDQSSSIAKAEDVRIVPTFKIYKNGTRVKEMICPDRQVLENSVRHYSH